MQPKSIDLTAKVFHISTKRMRIVNATLKKWQSNKWIDYKSTFILQIDLIAKVLRWKVKKVTLACDCQQFLTESAKINKCGKVSKDTIWVLSLSSWMIKSFHLKWGGLQEKSQLANELQIFYSSMYKKIVASRYKQ